MEKMNLSEIMTSGGRVKLDRLNATSEADIDRHAREDGAEDHEGLGKPYPTPATVRRTLGLTQKDISSLIGVPLKTWQNWEQERVRIEPAVQTLLCILWKEPDAVRRAQKAA